MSFGRKKSCVEISSISEDYYDLIRWHCPKCNGVRGNCLVQTLQEAASPEPDEDEWPSVAEERPPAPVRAWLH